MRNQPELLPPKAIRNFPSLSREEMWPDANAHMFQEDIHTMIMPYDLKPEYQFVLEGQSSDVLIAESLLDSVSRNGHGDIREKICDAIRDVVSSLVYDGTSCYEILRESESGRPQRLSQFTSKRLISCPIGHIQVFPRADSKAWGKKFVFLPGSSVWKISIPRELGGVKGFQNLRIGISRFNDLGPKFWMKNLEQHNLESTFSFHDYVQVSRIQKSRATINWGWNFRDSSQTHTTEVYWILRSIQFGISLAILRKSVVVEMNKLFKRLKLECSLKVEGLPTVESLQSVKMEFINGEIRFADILDRIGLN